LKDKKMKKTAKALKHVKVESVKKSEAVK